MVLSNHVCSRAARLARSAFRLLCPRVARLARNAFCLLCPRVARLARNAFCLPCSRVSRATRFGFVCCARVVVERATQRDARPARRAVLRFAIPLLNRLPRSFSALRARRGLYLDSRDSRLCYRTVPEPHYFIYRIPATGFRLPRSVRVSTPAPLTPKEFLHKFFWSLSS